MTKKVIDRTITDEELLPDNILLCRFIIDGRPATKKTHQSAFITNGRTVVLPSKQYKKFEKVAKPFCEDAWKNLGKDPMDFGVAVKILIFLDNWSIGDHVGYMQAIGDILEKHGVIANDKFIHWSNGDTHWFGGVDKEQPRTEIEISRFRHPYEEYRAKKEGR
jgi:hypothetical protein